MELGLPLDHAHYIIAQGSSYDGGWPEVFFELGGPFGGFILVALSAIAFSEFMFLMMRCIVQERFATCFFIDADFVRGVGHHCFGDGQLVYSGNLPDQGCCRSGSVYNRRQVEVEYDFRRHRSFGPEKKARR